jgi:hypothetical protein
MPYAPPRRSRGRQARPPVIRTVQLVGGLPSSPVMTMLRQTLAPGTAELLVAGSRPVALWGLRPPISTRLRRTRRGRGDGHGSLGSLAIG